MTDRNEAPGPLADFGYEHVPWAEKKARVRGVFDSVAPRYDLMNDVMSGGLHRLWKRFTLAKTGLRHGQSALDVAAGSGDLARRAGAPGRPSRARRRHRHQRDDARGRPRPAARRGPRWQRRLRARGRRSAAVRGLVVPLRDDRLRPAQRHGQGRGARVAAQRAEARRTPARPRVFASAAGPLGPLYELYSFRCCRGSGALASDAASYRYLAESIRRHPDQETLKGMMERAGFERCELLQPDGGIVALHVGFRL